jgi:hypothetical protein
LVQSTTRSGRPVRNTATDTPRSRSKDGLPPWLYARHLPCKGMGFPSGLPVLRWRGHEMGLMRSGNAAPGTVSSMSEPAHRDRRPEPGRSCVLWVCRSSGSDCRLQRPQGIYGIGEIERIASRAGPHVENSNSYAMTQTVRHPRRQSRSGQRSFAKPFSYIPDLRCTPKCQFDGP